MTDEFITSSRRSLVHGNAFDRFHHHFGATAVESLGTVVGRLGGHDGDGGHRGAVGDGHLHDHGGTTVALIIIAGDFYFGGTVGDVWGMVGIGYNLIIAFSESGTVDNRRTVVPIGGRNCKV